MTNLSSSRANDKRRSVDRHVVARADARRLLRAFGLRDPDDAEEIRALLAFLCSQVAALSDHDAPLTRRAHLDVLRQLTHAAAALC